MTATPSIDVAGAGDIDRLVGLQQRLFTEDAGRHDTFVDLTWPEREGTNDFERLLADDDSIVLAARHETAVVGYLVGYRKPSSATRLDVAYGVLRSLYVEPAHRRSGAAGRLVGRFLTWARDQGCVEAHVTSYAANEAATQLYQREGFEARSIVRVRRLDTTGGGRVER